MKGLWVRWFDVVPGHRYGLKTGRLSNSKFFLEDKSAPFAFLNHALVIRRCHFIPSFEERPVGNTDDWCALYVN